jgi:hypothetical protein
MQGAVSGRRRRIGEGRPAFKLRPECRQNGREHDHHPREMNRAQIVGRLLDIGAGRSEGGSRCFFAMVRPVLYRESIVDGRGWMVVMMRGHATYNCRVTRGGTQLVAARKRRQRGPDERQQRQQCQKNSSALASSDSHRCTRWLGRRRTTIGSVDRGKATLAREGVASRILQRRRPEPGSAGRSLEVPRDPPPTRDPAI